MSNINKIQQNRETDINRYLEGKGIKHALSGYRFLFELIQLGMEDRTRLIKMTDMYNMVSEMYEVEPNSIERAIRYSIKEYGLTSKEFITKAVDDLLYGDGMGFMQLE